MTEALEMPRFAFENMSFKDDSEVEAYEAKQNEGKKTFVDKHFKPGRYEVVIEKVEFKGKATKDPTWLNVIVHLKGTGEKRINTLIQVPTQDIKYGDKGTLFPYQNYKKFCAAAGREIKSVSDVPATTKALFAQPEKLVDLPIIAEMGYEKAYAQYVGKKEDGSKVYNLIGRDGEAARDADGVILTFGDHAAVELYCNTASPKIQYSPYLSVRAFDKSAALKSDSTDEIDF